MDQACPAREGARRRRPRQFPVPNSQLPKYAHVRRWSSCLQTCAAVLAESRVSVIPCAARCATTHLVGWILNQDAALTQSAGDLSLDLRSIPHARIELTQQTRRATAEACAHLVEVLLGHLAHVAIEFELFDR